MSKHSFGHKNSGHSGSRGAESQDNRAADAEDSAKSRDPAGEKDEAADAENQANTGASVQGDDPLAQGAEPAGLSEKNAELEAKLAELNDLYLRKTADFENFRKRMSREKQELVDFANQNLLLDLLPVIDDFERAIKSAETCPSLKNSKEFSGFYEGVIMIEKSLSTKLENKWGLKRFDSEGEVFDPNRHEAIQMEKSAEITEAVVKDDYLKGYLLKDRVIRFAKVKVLVPEDGVSARNSGADANAGEGERDAVQ